MELRSLLLILTVVLVPLSEALGNMKQVKGSGGTLHAPEVPPTFKELDRILEDSQKTGFAKQWKRIRKSEPRQRAYDILRPNYDFKSVDDPEFTRFLESRFVGGKDDWTNSFFEQSFATDLLKSFGLPSVDLEMLEELERILTHSYRRIFMLSIIGSGLDLPRETLLQTLSRVTERFHIDYALASIAQNHGSAPDSFWESLPEWQSEETAEIMSDALLSVSKERELTEGDWLLAARVSGPYQARLEAFFMTTQIKVPSFIKVLAKRDRSLLFPEEPDRFTLFEALPGLKCILGRDGEITDATWQYLSKVKGGCKYFRLLAEYPHFQDLLSNKRKYPEILSDILYEYQNDTEKRKHADQLYLFWQAFTLDNAESNKNREILKALKIDGYYAYPKSHQLDMFKIFFKAKQKELELGDEATLSVHPLSSIDLTRTKPFHLKVAEWILDNPEKANLDIKFIRSMRNKEQFKRYLEN